jgi:3-oxoadipate enol-lactonase
VVGRGPHLAADIRVIALDARGHGRSPVVPRPYSLEIMADDACLVLEKLGIAKAHWVGLSMGGMVGQAFALRHPARLMKLVIANSTCSYGPRARDVAGAREGGAGGRARGDPRDGGSALLLRGVPRASSRSAWPR